MNKILIVDDSQLVRNFHSYMVKEAGFEVTTAVDGADALEKCFRNHYDIILTDINMQGMDGYEFIRRLRMDDQYDDVPIIIISTEGRENDKLKGLKVGANLYLVKPSDATRIVKSIRMLLGETNKQHGKAI